MGLDACRGSTWRSAFTWRRRWWCATTEDDLLADRLRRLDVGRGVGGSRPWATRAPPSWRPPRGRPRRAAPCEGLLDALRVGALDEALAGLPRREAEGPRRRRRRRRRRLRRLARAARLRRLRGRRGRLGEGGGGFMPAPAAPGVISPASPALPAGAGAAAAGCREAGAAARRWGRGGGGGACCFGWDLRLEARVELFGLGRRFPLARLRGGLALLGDGVVEPEVEEGDLLVGEVKGVELRRRRRGEGVGLGGVRGRRHRERGGVVVRPGGGGG